MRSKTHVPISWLSGFLALLLALSLAAQGEAGTTWTVRLQSVPPLYSVTHGGGQFVAVGVDGAILTSTDGVSWRARTSGTGDMLWAVTHGGGQFVAVGVDGTILTSTDGVSWRARTSGTGNTLLAVTHGGGQFVAVGEKAIVLTSP